MMGATPSAAPAASAAPVDYSALSVEERMEKIRWVLWKEDSVEKVKAIVGSTPLAEMKDKDGGNLLRLGAWRNRVKVCEFLLDSKMDIEVATQV